MRHSQYSDLTSFYDYQAKPHAGIHTAISHDHIWRHQQQRGSISGLMV